MPKSAADHRLLSQDMWWILDGIGLSPCDRESVVSTTMPWEILRTVMRELTGRKRSVYRFGSACESTTIPGLESDWDVDYVHENWSVVNTLHDAPRHGPCSLLVRDNDTAPGYAKLQYVKDGIPMTAGRLGALRSDRKWRNRNRRHNWPSSDVLQKLCSIGCLVVGVGHPHSTEQTLEWRMSFALQERYLMLSLNEVQHKCYVLMKVVKEDILIPHLGESITSYHCKTVLFYVIESTSAEFWVPGNLITCLLYSLKALYKCTVDGFCPSYFIPGANLFDSRVHGKLRQQVIDQLGGLLTENCNFLFRIKCDDIGLKLSAACNSRKYVAPLGMTIYSSQKEKSCIRLGHAIILSANQILEYSTSINDPATSINNLRDQLVRLVNTTRVTEHTEDQTREAMQYLLPFLHTSLAAHLAARLLCEGPDANEAEDIRHAMGKHMQQVCASGLVSCRLKMAAIHYMLEEYTTCEDILSQCVGSCLFNICACVWNVWTVYYKNNDLLDKIATESMSCADIVKQCLGYCISFMPTELGVMPVALQYELKSKQTCPETRDPEKGRFWYDWCNVDANIFLYYMQYLVYDKTCDVGRKQRALQNLENVVITDTTLYHRNTAYNLLGWIHNREGDVIAAERCFQESIRLEPEHSAATWHIRDLKLRQTMTTSPCQESTRLRPHSPCPVI